MFRKQKYPEFCFKLVLVGSFLWLFSNVWSLKLNFLFLIFLFQFVQFSSIIIFFIIWFWFESFRWIKFRRFIWGVALKSNRFHFKNNLNVILFFIKIRSGNYNFFLLVYHQFYCLWHFRKFLFLTSNKQQVLQSLLPIN